ncbi:MAG: hypothetical protein IPL41_03440 [Micropruina sp.]|nr:hypothetical protein [Micropruina sp.]
MDEYISTWADAIIGLQTTLEEDSGGHGKCPLHPSSICLNSIQVGADLYTEDNGPLNRGESGRLVALRFWAPEMKNTNATVNGRDPSWFDWEMYILREAGADGHAIFYRNGVPVPNPFNPFGPLI